jgi:hypothetical protein
MIVKLVLKRWCVKFQVMLKIRLKLVVHLLARMPVHRWLPLFVNKLVVCSSPVENMIVNRVDASFRVKLSSVINVRMLVFST